MSDKIIGIYSYDKGQPPGTERYTCQSCGVRWYATSEANARFPMGRRSYHEEDRCKNLEGETFPPEEAQRDIPSTHEIKAYFHCGLCLKELPAGTSPKEYASLECGWTILGFQVWCKRHQANVVHVDFEGVKHPANTTRTPDPELPMLGGKTEKPSA
jgi:hypothetical protein